MQRTLQTNRESILRCACQLVCLISLGMVSSGCRTIQSGRQTRNLAAARQLSLQGASLLQQRSHSEAGPLFSEALERSAADERAHWGLAEVLWDEGDRNAALDHMRQAVELSGKKPEWIVRLGQMQLELGNLDKALEQANLALSIERQFDDAWALKGDVLKKKNMHADALDCYNRALFLNPSDANARIAVASIYEITGQPQRVLSAIDRLADTQPTESIPARAWMLKGKALSAFEQADDAQQCLQEAVARANNQDCELLVELASLQLESGDLAEARLCLGRALRNNPQNPAALNLQKVLNHSFQAYSEQNRTAQVAPNPPTPAWLTSERKNHPAR